MATSNSRDFTMTKDSIIRGALRTVGVISTSQRIDSDTYNEASDTLNRLVKAWQSKGIFLWCEEWKEITVNAGTNSFQADQDVLAVKKLILKVNNDEENRIKMITHNEFQDIVNKTDTGEPNIGAVKIGLSHTVYLYPTLDNDYVIKYLAEMKLQDFDNLLDNMDFLSNWTLALEYGLAFLLSYKYSLPVEEKYNLEKVSLRYFLEAKRKSGDTEEEERFVSPCY